MATVALLGTLDTKGTEYRFVADAIRQRGHGVLIIDVGTLDPPVLEPHIGRDTVLEALEPEVRPASLSKDRGSAIATMVQAAPIVVARLAAEGRIDAILALGGGGGTAIGTAAMRALPIGFPKLMVSTLASGDTSAYVGEKDIVMMPSIVDVAGLNRVSRKLFAQAAGAICGMLEAPSEAADEGRPIVVASMFGNTTACVQGARTLLEAAGYEVLVFHATGTGGRTMESLIASGLVAGVLDVTTTEWADQLVGGVLAAGEDRLQAAAQRGVPAVIAPGCLDMVNFHAPDTVPKRFQDRLFYAHNPQVTLMRTNAEECDQLGHTVAEKLNQSRGPVSVLLPLKGISILSESGGPFHDPIADAALFGALKTALRSDIALRELECTINDAAFARACAEELLRLMTASGSTVSNLGSAVGGESREHSE